MSSPHDVLISLLAGGGIAVFLGGVGSLAASLLHRQPDIDWLWILKTRLSKHNFTPRGRRLRRRGWVLMLIGFAAMWAGSVYRVQVHGRPAST
ncbi:MAG: hypothetical protein V3T70_04715, partial [Phycisphaerae bacterium]